MARESGQRTKIVLGNVQAMVSLVKASGEPSAAKWETRRVDAQGNEIVDSTAIFDPDNFGALPPGQPDGDVGAVVPSVDAERAAAGDPFAPRLTETVAAPASPPSHAPVAPIIPATREQAMQRDSLAGVPSRQEVITQRGVRTEAGDFVDLTATLAAIDERVKLDGIVIDGAVPSNAIPRERVRGAMWVVPQDELGRRVVALLFDALSDAGRALAVRWTKRTNQAQGIVVASKTHGALMLLETEWHANMRSAPAKAVVAAHTAALSEAERDAAADYVKRLSEPASALNEFEDERRGLQAQALYAAKAGEKFELPAAPKTADDGLAAALSQS